MFYPYHQNVLWTFLLSLLLIALIAKCKTSLPPVPAAFLSAGLAILGFVLGYAFYPVHMLLLYIAREMILG